MVKPAKLPRKRKTSGNMAKATSALGETAAIYWAQ